MIKNWRMQRHIKIACLIIGIILLAAINISTIKGSVVIQPPRPTITPIPQQTVTLIPQQTVTRIPRPTLTAKPQSQPVKEVKARIILTLDIGQFVPLHWWTIVQWENFDGGWHDVNGWRGQFNQNSQVVWGVNQKDFGTGPFRWIIYDTENANKVLWTSDSFHLPMHNETLKINASTNQVFP
jgi:hypothetical protein